MIRNERFLRREYIRTLIPVMFSVLAGTVNTLIDSVFVAQRMGSDGLAAINMCGPLYQILCTLGSLLAGGASILSAQEDGLGELEKGHQYYRAASFYCIVTGVLLSAAGLIFCRPISVFLAQNGNLTEYVYDYSIVTFLGLIAVAFAYIPLYYLQLEGKIKEMMIMMCIVIVSDLVLDWVLLYALDLGISGAAAASVLSMLLACVYGIVELKKVHPGYHISLKKADRKGWKEIIRFGSPVAVGNFFDAVRLFLLNSIIFRTGGSMAVAIWAVLNSFSELSLSMIGGVPQAASPMIGVFYSARENSGIRILMKLQTKIGLSMISLYAVLLLAFHRVIEGVFALPDSILLPLACLGISLIFEMLCGIWGSYFNSAGRITLSNILMAVRTFAFPIGTALILKWTGGYLWLFLPLGGFFALVTLWVITGRISFMSRKTEHPFSRILLLDDYLERNGLVLDFSIEPSEEKICDASDRIKDFCDSAEMDAKTTNRIRLAIEELLIVMKAANPKMKSVDLRAFALDDATGIRIRCAGESYNPFEHAEQAEDDFYMGISMIQRMAGEIKHSYTLGMNTIYLNFGKKKKTEGV